MHELSLARSALELALAHAGGARVRAVVLEVGALALVVPEALRAAFEVVTRGTALEGAELRVEVVPGRARCGECGAEVALASAWEACPCGSRRLSWLAGQELVVRALEVVSV